jgi:hypothetical protein
VTATKNAIAALWRAHAYFAERADAQYFPDRPDPVGNEEMNLLTECEDALIGLGETL